MSSRRKKPGSDALPEQIAVSKVLAKIGIPVLAEAFGKRERTIALWIKRGRIPSTQLEIINQRWPGVVRRAKYVHAERTNRQAWCDLPGAHLARWDTPSKARQEKSAATAAARKSA